MTLQHLKISRKTNLLSKLLLTATLTGSIFGCGGEPELAWTKPYVELGSERHELEDPDAAMERKVEAFNQRMEELKAKGIEPPEGFTADVEEPLATASPQASSASSEITYRNGWCYSAPKFLRTTPRNVEDSFDIIKDCLETPPPGEQWNEEKLNKAFEHQTTHNFIDGYIGTQEVQRRIPWLFPIDGCFTRADLARDLMTEIGVPNTRKIFISGKLNAYTSNLKAKGDNDPGEAAKPGIVTWGWHVANVATWDDRGEIKVSVLDPAVEPSGYIDFEDWRDKITQVTDTEITQALEPSGLTISDLSQEQLDNITFGLKETKLNELKYAICDNDSWNYAIGRCVGSGLDKEPLNFGALNLMPFEQALGMLGAEWANLRSMEDAPWFRKPWEELGLQPEN